jgi:small subunit ribosomal protein S6
MRRYESVVILDPDMPDDDTRSFTERFSSVITSSGGDIIKIEDWGTKRLAYLVKKKERGRYILFDFVGTSELIKEIERQFKISEQVMKFLSIKIDDQVDLATFKASEEPAEADSEVVASPADSEDVEDKSTELDGDISLQDQTPVDNRNELETIPTETAEKEVV